MSPWFVSSMVLTALGWLGWAVLYLGGVTFPEKTPIHWNIDMQPDGWVRGDVAIWWLLPFPAIATLLVGLNAMLPRWSPSDFKEPSTRGKLDFTIFAVSAFSIVLTGLVARGMYTAELPIKPFLGAFFALFGVLGWAMRGLKQNRWVGVRTPWTLRSEAVWARTHDLAAWIWMALGVVGLAAVLANAPPLVCVLMILPAVITPVVASYLYSRAAR